MRLKVGSNAYESVPIKSNTENSSCGPNAEGWERVYVSGEIEEEATVELVADAASGSVWFACAQLEIGEIPNRVNLLSNGRFFAHSGEHGEQQRDAGVPGGLDGILGRRHE